MQIKDPYIGRNKINAKGAQEIANLISVNKTIKSLWLGSYPDAGSVLVGNDFGPDGSSFIGQAMKNNKTIICLYLNNVNVGPEGAKGIAQIIKENSSLTFLDISNIIIYAFRL